MGKYVNNEEFYKELLIYNQTGADVISDKIVTAFTQIGEKISKMKMFNRYPEQDLEDMRGEALFWCVKYIKKFETNKSENPFSYFTTVTYNGFLKFLKKKYKQKNILDALKEQEEDECEKILINGNIYYRNKISKSLNIGSVDVKNTDVVKEWNDRIVFKNKKNEIGVFFK